MFISEAVLFYKEMLIKMNRSYMKREENKEKIVNNKGSVSVEASIVIPIFIFSMLAFIYICSVISANSVIYEAAIETAEYLAEYAYLKTELEGIDAIEAIEYTDYIMAHAKFSEYIDDETIVSQTIKGGVNGISFWGSDFKNEDFIKLKVSYEYNLSIPIIGNLIGKNEFEISQKPYIGHRITESSDEGEEKDVYVYVTDNNEAYHSRRYCSYLIPQYATIYKKNVPRGLSECVFCKGIDGQYAYITENATCYHNTPACSVLKRNIYRKKLSEVGDLSPCKRCY